MWKSSLVFVSLLWTVAKCYCMHNMLVFLVDGKGLVTAFLCSWQMGDTDIKGRTQCRRLPALCGVWGRVVLSPKPYPHKCAEAGTRTRDLPGLCNWQCIALKSFLIDFYIKDANNQLAIICTRGPVLFKKTKRLIYWTWMVAYSKDVHLLTTVSSKSDKTNEVLRKNYIME